MTNLPISDELIAEANAREMDALEDEYGALGRKLERAGIDIDTIKDKVADFSVAVPSWGAGRGGTRFAKFPIAGEPTSIHEKLEDCAVINQLSRLTPRVSPHLPWDKVSDYGALREEAASLGLGFHSSPGPAPRPAAQSTCWAPIARTATATARRRSARPSGSEQASSDSSCGEEPRYLAETPACDGQGALFRVPREQWGKVTCHAFSRVS